MAEIPKMVLAAIVVLGGMIVIHEFGHFIVAKAFRVRVYVFSIGFGKRLWGFRKGDTDYRLSLVPLGGYVKMAGENADEQLTGDPAEFMSKPKWQRLCVAVAGPAMNIITAIAVPAIIATIHYQVPAYVDKPAVVGDVEAGSPAEQAGIQRGDVITKVEGETDPTWGDFSDLVTLSPNQPIRISVKRGNEARDTMISTTSLGSDSEKRGYSGIDPALGPNTKLELVDDKIAAGSAAEEAGLKPADQILAVNGERLDQNFHGRNQLIRAIQNSGGQKLVLSIKRGDELMDLTATAKPDKDGTYKLGFYPFPVDQDTVVTKLSPSRALRYSVRMNINILMLTKMALGQVFVGKRSIRDTVAGPIQILKYSGEAASQGPQTVLMLMSFLSLNLGVFNLLPIPILDGGMIFMTLLEGALGTVGLSLTARVQDGMRKVGFVLLMLLMIFVLVNDITKLGH